MQQNGVVLGAIAALVFVCAVDARAGTPPEVFEGDVKKEANKKTNANNPGWHVQFDVGASVSLSGNDNVVGQPSGLSWTLGANIGLNGGYRQGAHDWLNKLRINLQFSNTPPISAFVKSADVFEFYSTYYYRAEPWVGPFVRFGLSTAMLPGEDVQADQVAYKVIELDGSDEDFTGSEFSLTDPFAPMTLKQSVGAFFRPYWETVAKVEYRVGLAAQEVLADQQLNVTEPLKDGVVVLEKLASANQVGAEMGVEVSGAFEDNKILYGVWLDALLPFYTDGPKAEDKAFDELINVEMGAKIAFKFVDWASLSYEFKAVRQPQLVDDWQISNNVLLTFGFSKKWVEEEPAKKK